MDFRKGRAREELEINLIPFIDVLLVILIFMMVTTTYSKFTALQITLPTADADKAQQRPFEINVGVDTQGHYAINNSQISATDAPTLAEELKKIAGEKGDEGDNGKSGQKGPAGADAELGAQGSKGPAGQPGAAGRDGYKGEQGPHGAPGPNGPPGAPGEHGFPGQEGTKGHGGPNGKGGEPGKDAQYCSCPRRHVKRFH